MSDKGNSFGPGRSTVDIEMLSFDVLGPLSRAAIANSRFQIGAASLVRAFKAQGVSPTDPAVDRAGARCVRDLDAKLAFQFGLEADAA